MSFIDVRILHPTDGRILDISIDPSFSADDLIEALIQESFIPKTQNGYHLALKGGPQLISDKSLQESGVTHDATIRILPTTEAGSPDFEFARSSRMRSDYREMLNLRGPILSWEIERGRPGFVEQYLLQVSLKTMISTEPDYRDSHQLRLIVPEPYPRLPPKIKMLTAPPPFHPNWYVDGLWCHGRWDFSEGLGHFVVRMLHTLRFDPEFTSLEDYANQQAGRWFPNFQARGLVPCTTTPMPDPISSDSVIQLNRKRPIIRIKN